MTNASIAHSSCDAALDAEGRAAPTGGFGVGVVEHEPFAVESARVFEDSSRQEHVRLPVDAEPEAVLLYYLVVRWKLVHQVKDIGEAGTAASFDADTQGLPACSANPLTCSAASVLMVIVSGFGFSLV